MQSVLDRRRLERGAQGAVGGDAPGQDDALDPVMEGRLDGLPHEHLHDRRLERRGNVRDLRALEGRVLLDVEGDRCLDAAEREVGSAVAHLRQREHDRLRIAAGRHAFDHGPPRKAEAEELRDFVERFAGGVVARLAHQRILERCPRPVQRRVAT